MNTGNGEWEIENRQDDIHAFTGTTNDKNPI